MRANSVKERNVVLTSISTDTAVKEERKVGKREWRGMYGRDLAFRGSGVLGNHVS